MERIVRKRKFDKVAKSKAKCYKYNMGRKNIGWVAKEQKKVYIKVFLDV